MEEDPGNKANAPRLFIWDTNGGVTALLSVLSFVSFTCLRHYFALGKKGIFQYVSIAYVKNYYFLTDSI